MKVLRILFIGVLFFTLFSFNSVIAQEKSTKADLPVLITSCGQSPGPTRIKLFLKKLKFEYIYETLATSEFFKENTEIKSMIIVTGASGKGMGAAGVSMKDELERTKEIITEAKKRGITIIAAHVEGMSRRAQGAAPGDNTDEQSIDAVCPNADFMVVRKDGNEDARFTAISKDKGIPLIEFEKNMEMLEVFKQIFGK